MKGGETMTRKAALRRVPDTVRYMFLMVGKKKLHLGLSHWGLVYASEKDKCEALYIGDLRRGIIKKTPESVEDFLTRWAAHYADPEWDYFAEVDSRVPPGV